MQAATIKFEVSAQKSECVISGLYPHDGLRSSLTATGRDQGDRHRLGISVCEFAKGAVMPAPSLPTFTIKINTTWLKCGRIDLWARC
jgi:hypothetical protein